MWKACYKQITDSCETRHPYNLFEHTELYSGKKHICCCLKLGLLCTKFLGNPNDRLTLQLIWCGKICYTSDVTWLPFHVHVHLYKIFNYLKRQIKQRIQFLCRLNEVKKLNLLSYSWHYCIYFAEKKNFYSFLNQSKLYIYVFKTNEWEIIVIHNFVGLFWCHVSQNMT